MRKNKDSKEVAIKHGFLYPTVNAFLNALKYLNLVEGFKFLGAHFGSQNSIQKISRSRYAVDFFICSKWLFVGILWMYKVSIPWLVYVVWYLLVTNLYTYFYYHTWSSDILKDTHFDAERVKRRFTTLILAVFYTIVGFAYLYSVPYSTEFTWSENTITVTKALWFSVSNSLSASYELVKPITEWGYSISMIQLLMMFVFLTIIIGSAIPQPQNSNK